jgi:hypothetical protein
MATIVEYIDQKPPEEGNVALDKKFGAPTFPRGA